MNNMITIQDINGNILRIETFKARIKQKFCNHDWIKVGNTYECPKCYSVKSKRILK